jgi:hypothetical protein
LGFVVIAFVFTFSFHFSKQKGIALEDFCDKFIELISEEGTTAEQKDVVKRLFEAVNKSGTKIPDTIMAKLP